MKTHSKSTAINSETNSKAQNQSSEKNILDSYKSSNAPIQNGAGNIQLKAYNASVKLEKDISAADLNNWNIVREKLGISKGEDADSSIAFETNASLTALGLQTGNAAMSAHMIPNRIGGAGDASNVRPWDRAFETGTWETDVERKFNAALVGEKDKTVEYKVNTTEMTEGEADVIIAKSTVATEKAKPEHKTNILQIPTKVSANAGGSTLAETTAPIANLIK